MVAALYVETDGAYFGLPDVDPWDEARDARLYAGPHPAAHLRERAVDAALVDELDPALGDAPVLRRPGQRLVGGATAGITDPAAPFVVDHDWRGAARLVDELPIFETVRRPLVLPLQATADADRIDGLALEGVLPLALDTPQRFEIVDVEPVLDLVAVSLARIIGLPGPAEKIGAPAKRVLTRYTIGV